MQFFLNALCMGLFCSQLPNLPFDAPQTVGFLLGLSDAFYKLCFLHHDLDLHLERIPHNVMELFIPQVILPVQLHSLPISAPVLFYDDPDEPPEHEERLPRPNQSATVHPNSHRPFHHLL